ncbi:MAG: DUF882 domain-containing protein [Polyangiaceae bacterium]
MSVFNSRSVIPFAALALAFIPAVAGAASRTDAKAHKPGVRAHHLRQARATNEPRPRECVKAPIEVVAGAESAKLSLAKCDGAAAPAGIEQLSTLARAPGARRLDARLVERLELVVDHFRKGTEPTRLVLVSGFRPRSAGSFHSTGRALDFRVDGVANDALVAFCKTLQDTGCGFYPNSRFIHMDVREPGTGHVAWTDASRPGEAPRYVTEDSSGSSGSSGLPELPALDADEREGEKRTGKDEAAHAL